MAINDENFAWAVKEYAQKADTNHDGYLSVKESSKVKQVEFYSSYNIDSLKGIEHFRNITDFFYRADEVSDYYKLKTYEMSTVEEIDLSGFKKLKNVRIQSSTPYLKRVHLRNCTGLEDLYIQGEPLGGNVDSLDIKGCTNLSSLDVRNHRKLTKINCQNNENLTEIKTEGCDNLVNLRCNDNPDLQQLNVTKNKNLRRLRCENTALTRLNVKKNARLKILYCDNTNISKLNLKNNKNLLTLSCTETNIKKLDLSKTKIKKPSALECDPDVSVIYAK